MDKRIKFICSLTFVLILSHATTSGYAQTTGNNFVPQSGQAGKDVVWVPTPQGLVDAMLKMANVTPADYVIDLGSGDGRLVITAAKLGATALGIEYNPDMVELAIRTSIEEGTSERAKFEKADLFESDFSKATVITMFLLPEINLRLRPKILDMKPGTRIVSNSFNMYDWEPDQTTRLTELDSHWATAYLWIVPAKVNGTWEFEGGQIKFIQTFQNISGTLTMGNVVTEFTGELNGDKISFNAGDTEFAGIVSGNTISGTHAGGDSWSMQFLHH